MRVFFNFWPAFVYLVLLFPLNVDIVFIPGLRAHGVMGLKLFYLSAALAAFGTIYGYWFWGWIGREIVNLKKIRETVEFGKEIVNEIKHDRYVKKRYFYKVVDHLIGQYEWATAPDNQVVRFIKKYRYWAMIFFGVEPFVGGGRTVGVICCRTFSWRMGLVTLTLADVAHVALLVWGWSKFFSFLGR